MHKEAMWSQRQRLEGCSHKPRDAWGHHEREEAGDCPQEPSEGGTPAHTSIADLQPQSHRRIRVCGFKPLVCGSLLWQPQDADALGSGINAPDAVLLAGMAESRALCSGNSSRCPGLPRPHSPSTTPLLQSRHHIDISGYRF